MCCLLGRGLHYDDGAFMNLTILVWVLIPDRYLCLEIGRTDINGDTVRLTNELCQDSNPKQRVKERERYLCALPLPWKLASFHNALAYCFQTGTSLDNVTVSLTPQVPSASTSAVNIGDSFIYTLTVDLVQLSWL